ncbi:hypothetical protein Clow_00324 [Corynebacterium lowii]|uniref:Uncharacterized protein n=1 Tax=Corynebacterium lowii TaxID=1544413 RepID=A0A0Q0UG58_9CORY|nr:hypothetical protein Clow_00324 [Corynebacterium lowii]MDP9852144.1 hypothetical protein [Corynebacterium lowii]
MNPLENLTLAISDALGQAAHLGSSELSELSLALHLF